MIINYQAAAPMLALFVGLVLIFAQFYDTPTASLQSMEEPHTLQYSSTDGALELIVAFSSASYMETQGTRTVYATVTAAPSPDREVTVKIALSGSGASLPNHPDGLVTIACGETFVDVAVQFQDESGSVTLTLSLPSGTRGVTLGRPARAVVSVGNPPPVFAPNTPTELSLPENSGAGDVVGVVAASDPGDMLSYRLSGEGSDKFEVDDTGRITVKSGAELDHESQTSYAMTVTATDSADQSAAVNLTIRIVDIDEPPPPVAAMSIRRNPDSPTSALDVSWAAPAVPSGVPAIIGFQLQYREQGKIDWNTHAQVEAVTQTTIGDLLSGTVYEVRVRTVNDEGESVWSLSGSKTDITELVVAFGSDSYIESEGSRTVATKVTVSPKADRTVRVNIEVVGEGAVLPRHPSGQAVIRRTAGLVTVPVEFQSDTGSVTLKLSLPAEAEGVTLGVPASAVVSIGDNPPPTVGDNQSQAPATTGQSGGGPVTVSGANTAPRFADGISTVRRIDENLPPGSNVGHPVEAVDSDPDDEVSYILAGVDFTSFEIDEKSGQIVVVETLDFEKKPSYSVRVIAKDPQRGTSTIEVTIEVTNVDEAGVAAVTVEETSPDGTIKATLSDPDGGVSNIRWKWQSSSDGTAAWADIPGATSNSYTPTHSMMNNLVRAVAFYTDAHGAGKSIEGETARAVMVERAQMPPPTPTPAPSPPPTPTSTPSAKPTALPTIAPTPAVASTPTRTRTLPPTHVPTAAPVLEVPQTATATPGSTAAPMPTRTPVPTPMPPPTVTPAPAARQEPTDVPIPTPTDLGASPLEDAVVQTMDTDGGGVPRWAYVLVLGVIAGVVLGVAIGWLAARMARR